MGTAFQAICTCGYEVRITLGGDRRSFRTHSYFPYRCATCGIVNVNICEKPLRCKGGPDHVLFSFGSTFTERLSRNVSNFFSHKSLKAKGLYLQTLLRSKRRMLAQWDDYKLYDVPHYCPQCQRVELRWNGYGINFD